MQGYHDGPESRSLEEHLLWAGCLNLNPQPLQGSVLQMLLRMQLAFTRPDGENVIAKTYVLAAVSCNLHSPCAITVRLATWEAVENVEGQDEPRRALGASKQVPG